MKIPRSIACLLVFGLLGFTACETDTIGKTVPVTGKVTVKGKAAHSRLDCVLA